jgi:hypothetical protein
MKSEFYDYCTDIGISETLLTQVRDAYSVAKRLLGEEEIDAVFITDNVDQSGVRNYANVFFFSEHKIAYFVLTNLAVCNILNWKGLHPVMQTSSQDYDFKKANTASRLRILLTTESNIGTRYVQPLSIHASGNNCDYLFKVYTEIISPHL